MSDSDERATSQALEFRRADDGDVAVLVVIGEIDVVTAPALRQELETIDDAEPKQIVVDCAGLQFIDSAGLQVVVDVHRRVEERGAVLVIRGLQGTPRRIFEITDLGRFLNLE